MAVDRMPSGSFRARLMIDGRRYTATLPTEAPGEADRGRLGARPSVQLSGAHRVLHGGAIAAARACGCTSRRSRPRSVVASSDEAIAAASPRRVPARAVYRSGMDQELFVVVPRVGNLLEHPQVHWDDPAITAQVETFLEGAPQSPPAGEGPVSYREFGSLVGV